MTRDRLPRQPVRTRRAWGKLSFKSLYGIYSSMTVNFDNSMTVAIMQALIDSLDKYIDQDVILTFQFADGTYTPITALTFRGFWGSGTLKIRGNTGESGLHTNQAVILDFSATDCDGIKVNSCYLYDVIIDNIHVKVDTTTTARIGIRIYHIPGFMILGCYTEGTGTVNQGAGIEVSHCIGSIQNHYINNTYYGVVGYNGYALMRDVDDTGTSPIYGLSAQHSTHFGQQGTQPTGSTADKHTTTGGIIVGTEVYINGEYLLPYTGAVRNVDLDSYDLTTTGQITVPLIETAGTTDILSIQPDATGTGRSVKFFENV